MEENKRIHTAKEEWDAYSEEYFAVPNLWAVLHQWIRFSARKDGGKI